MEILNKSNVFNHVQAMLEYHYGNDPRYDNTVFVLGYNMLSSANSVRKWHPGKRIICYQLEQLYEGSPWARKQLKEVLAESDEVWDYDATNIEFMKKWYKVDAKLHPILWTPTLKTIKQIPNEEKDIDVLFYGYMFERRGKLIFELQKRFKNQKVIYDVYGIFGEILDELIARSKIILNCHSKSVARQEQVRMMYPVINNCCVVTEIDKPDYMGNSVIKSTIEAMPAEIERLLNTNDWRYWGSKASENYFEISKLHERIVLSQGIQKEPRLQGAFIEG